MCTISTEWIPIIGTLGGAFITGLTAFGIHWSNKRSEERKHLNQILLSTAVENWKRSCDMALEKKGKVRIAPLDSYILHMLKLSELILNKPLSPKDIKEKFKELREFTDAHKEFLEETDKAQPNNAADR